MDVSLLINKIKQSPIGYPELFFNEKGKIATFINPLQYYLARKNWNVYSKFDYVFVDGISVVKIIKLLYGISVPRLSFDMTTMARDFFSWINIQNNKSIYLIGSSQDSIVKAVRNYKSVYPNLNIIGYRNGYFNNASDRESTIEYIVKLNPDYVIVGMGSIIQEKFALDLKEKGYNGLAVTCGGFFHQSAQGIEYYPKWVDKYNLRAIYRLFTEKGVYKKWTKIPIIFFKFILDYIPTKKSLINN